MLKTVSLKNRLRTVSGRPVRNKEETMEKKIYNLLAFDLGASNGRAILGRFDGEKVEMQELHRFENNYVEMNGVYYWDLP